MTRVFEIPSEAVVPGEAGVLRALGGRDLDAHGARVERLLRHALDEFRRQVRPRGIVADVDAAGFAAIYEGEGDNEIPSPLAEIFPRASSLVLFAATVGAPVGERIAALFDAGDFALGAALDAAASEGTELAGVFLERAVLREAREKGAARETRVLRYSPGYCGWNLTGQRALFSALDPGAIGIRLNARCLMDPLKSISGVMVLGPAGIHDFDNDYGFCAACRTKDCRTRVRNLVSDAPEGDDDGGAGEDRR